MYYRPGLLGNMAARMAGSVGSSFGRPGEISVDAPTGNMSVNSAAGTNRPTNRRAEIIRILTLLQQGGLDQRTYDMLLKQLAELQADMTAQEEAEMRQLQRREFDLRNAPGQTRPGGLFR